MLGRRVEHDDALALVDADDRIHRGFEEAARARLHAFERPQSSAIPSDLSVQQQGDDRNRRQEDREPDEKRLGAALADEPGRHTCRHGRDRQGNKL